MSLVDTKFRELCAENSDINEHLPTLYKYARECESIFETGVRGVKSSWAFVKGLLDNEKSRKYILLNDIDECNIEELSKAVKGTDIQLDYVWKNNLTLDMSGNVDLTFIDTWHIYGQLKRELEKFSKTTNKYIIMHDTTVDEIYGEFLRDERCDKGIRINTEKILTDFSKLIQEGVPQNHALYMIQINHEEILNVGMSLLLREADITMKRTGFSLEDITNGLRKAVDEFLQVHPEWVVHERYTNNNGLTILKRVSF